MLDSAPSVHCFTAPDAAGLRPVPTRLTLDRAYRETMTANSRETTADVLKVAVVNDYEIIVRGVAAMLADHDSVEVVELDSDLPVARPVDVALYDAFAMPSIEESDVVDLVDRANVGTVVLYTWRANPETVAQARSRGLGGVIVKGEPVATLVQLLHDAHDGKFVTSAHVEKAPPKGQPAARHWPGKDEGLTAREAEVVGLITQGLSNQEIAERMFVSINSIKSYIRAAYRTMGVTSRSQAVLWGVEKGLAPERIRVLLDGDEAPAEIV